MVDTPNHSLNNRDAEYFYKIKPISFKVKYQENLVNNIDIISDDINKEKAVLNQISKDNNCILKKHK